MRIVKVPPQRLDFVILVEQTSQRFCDKFRNGRRPRIEATFVDHDTSSGRAWPGLNLIRMSVGRDTKNMEYVLLHELSHIISDHRHGPKFYAAFKKAIRWAGFDFAYVVAREAWYKPRNSKTLTKGKRRGSPQGEASGEGSSPED